MMNAPIARAGQESGAARHFWVMPDSQSRWMWKHVAHHIAARTGLRPVFIVPSAQDKRYYETSFGVPFEGEIVVSDDFYDLVVAGGQPGADAAAVRDRARAYERRHGVGLLREMILADRHLGRGFIVGAKGHPTSAISKKATMDLALQACLMSADFYDRLAEHFPPAFVAGYFIGGGLAGKPLALLCRERGVPFRMLASCRFGSFFYWGVDEFARCPSFARFFRSFRTPDEAEVDAVQRRVAPNALAGPEMMRALTRQLGWGQIARKSLYQLAHKIYMRARGYRFGRIGYRTGSVIAQLVRSRRDYDRLRRIGADSLDAFKDRKIVFFPFQQEPESSTLVLTPHFSNQFAILVELALSLPADAVLVVKEHPWQLGRRTRGVYDAILEIPNVVMLAPTFPSLDIIRRSAAVCAISSSAAHEAAVMGKPVLYFQRGSTLEALDHVHVLDSVEQLDRIRDILDSATPEREARWRRDGARYLLALEAFCLEIGGPSIVMRQDPPSAEEQKKIADSLFASLGEQEASDMQPAPAVRSAV